MLFWRKQKKQIKSSSPVKAIKIFFLFLLLQQKVWALQFDVMYQVWNNKAFGELPMKVYIISGLKVGHIFCPAAELNDRYIISI